MQTSVIIPTYKRPQTLLQALSSLQEQTLREFEIIVVDNAADSELEKILTQFNATARVSVRYVPEPRLGLHYGRHRGIQIAKSQLLIFTDDDATFDPDWLQAYVTAFTKHPEMVASGGPVRPKWEAPPPTWLLEFLEQVKYFRYILSLMEPHREFCLSNKGYFFGVNMAILRHVLFEVGGFNPEAFGDIWLGDGETGLVNKLREREMLIGYVPEAIVYHHIPPQRMTVEYLCRRMANEGASDRYTRFHRQMPPRWYLFIYAIAIALKNSQSWIAAQALQGRTDPYSLGIQLNAAKTQAQVNYLLKLVQDKEFRKLVLKQDWLNEA